MEQFNQFSGLDNHEGILFCLPGPPGTVVWSNVAGGNWDDFTSWSPPVVPVAGMTAFIDLSPDVVVNIGAGIEAEASWIILEDKVRVSRVAACEARP